MVRCEYDIETGLEELCDELRRETCGGTEVDFTELCDELEGAIDVGFKEVDDRDELTAAPDEAFEEEKACDDDRVAAAAADIELSDAARAEDKEAMEAELIEA